MACGRLGPPELLLIFLLILLLFGASRLPEIGRGMGEGIRKFKKGLRDGDETDKSSVSVDESKSKDA